MAKARDVSKEGLFKKRKEKRGGGHLQEAPHPPLAKERILEEFATIQVEREEIREKGIRIGSRSGSGAREEDLKKEQ